MTDSVETKRSPSSDVAQIRAEDEGGIAESSSVHSADVLRLEKALKHRFDLRYGSGPAAAS